MLNEAKLVIFDLDGVLIDSKELHFEALNEALRSISSKFEITPREHATKYDGLSTKKKLEMLRQEKGLKPESFDQVWKLKQEITVRMLGEIKIDETLVEFMKYIKAKNLSLAVASNSVRNTIDIVLRNLGISNFFTLILSNEDVTSPKPHPEIYWKVMTHFGVLPENTVIFEDSYVGRLAAQRSGARLIPVDNRGDLNWEKIKLIDYLSSTLGNMDTPWKSEDTPSQSH